jgi:sec-independent protein translocase protein TatC
VIDHPKPFTEHLEELRVRLIKSLLSVALGTACAYPFVDRAIEHLSKPVGSFIFLQPTEAFFVRLKIALALGAVAAAPAVIFQVWSFVAVALTPVEKKSLVWILPASYTLFVLGISFGFFFLVPAGVKFLLSYGTPHVVPMLGIEHYINFVGTICLVLGGVFQMPLAAFFLSKIGLLDPRRLSDKRRIAVLVIYIASAFLTPGPDPVTAIMLAVPAYLLFECSILTAGLARKGESLNP